MIGQVGLQQGSKTFKIDAKFTAKGPFGDYLTNLGTRSFEKCFIFRGYPNILRNRKTSAIVDSGSADANPDPNQSPDSSTDDSIVENSWQKHPLKGAQVDDLPEKLGEMLAGLYIVLMSKILQGLMKNKDIKKIHRESSIGQNNRKCRVFHVIRFKKTMYYFHKFT